MAKGKVPQSHDPQKSNQPTITQRKQQNRELAKQIHPVWLACSDHLDRLDFLSDSLSQLVSVMAEANWNGSDLAELISVPLEETTSQLRESLRRAVTKLEEGKPGVSHDLSQRQETVSRPLLP